MRFELTAEQRAFAASLDEVLAGADTPSLVRSWAAGDHGPGLKLWARLADLGVTALLVPEAAGGIDASRVDLVVAFEALGRHAAPGPWIESAAYLPTLLASLPGGELLPRLAEGAVATVAVPPHTPRALDADAAQHVLLVTPSGEVRRAVPGALRRSVDPARRLVEVTPGELLATAPATTAAYDVAVLACAAQLLGLGEHLLERTVAYAGQRRQFGRPIGEYQALKHALADVRVRLDFARPLLYGAALALDAGTAEAARDVSAAAVAVVGAAHLAAGTALQLHGAIGFTAEYDLSLWLLKVRALAAAWGTPSQHRSRVLEALTEGRTW